MAIATFVNRNCNCDLFAIHFCKTAIMFPTLQLQSKAAFRALASKLMDGKKIPESWYTYKQAQRGLYDGHRRIFGALLVFTSGRAFGLVVGLGLMCLFWPFFPFRCGFFQQGQEWWARR
jgi:hypothetical protein